MNRNDWLKELDRELSRRMPDRDREDTLRYYEEYFEEAGPEREAEVAEELGAPDALARRLAEEGGWTQQKKGISPRAVIAGAAAAVLVAAVCAGGWFAVRQAASVPPPPGSSQSPSLPTPPQSQELETSPTPPQGQVPETPPASVSPSPAQDPEPSQSENPGSGPVQALDAFTGIEAQIAVGDVTVRSGAEFQIEIEVRGNVNGEPYRIEYELTSGVLSIASFPKRGKMENCHAAVTVTVPKERELDEIRLNTDVGDLSVRELSAGKIELHADVGDVTAADAAAGQICLTADVGDARLSGIPAETMELSTDVGDIVIRLDCAVDKCSYTLTSDVGKITANGISAKSRISQTATNGSCGLTASADVGSVTLEFRG